MLAVGLAFLIGTFVGSFLNVCIHRLPRNESIVSPRSRCYSCGTAVAWYDNIPVISWLALRGRCRWCGASFSVRYLLIEAAVGALTALAVWLAFSATPDAWSAQWLQVLQRVDPFEPEPTLISKAVSAGAALALIYFLVVSTITDLHYMIIPDELTKSFQVAAPFLGALCGQNLIIGWNPFPWLAHPAAQGLVRTPLTFVELLLAVTVPALLLLALSLPLARWIYTRFVPENARWEDNDHRGFAIGVAWFIASCVPPIVAASVIVMRTPGDWPWYLAVGLAQAVLGGLAGWLSLYLVGLVGTVVFRRNAMGFGDVKFLAPIGCFVGPVGVLYVFFIAALVGSVIGVPLRLLSARREIPFGPYLAVGALIVLGWGPELHQVAMRLLSPG